MQLEDVTGRAVSRETYDSLQTYKTLLEKWNKTINLVAPATLTHGWQRHFLDSAQLERLLPPSARVVLDFGSGAGFPGLVLAALGAESRRFILCESDQRKSQFLRAVSRETGVGVDVVCKRIEEIDPDEMAGVDVVTARAFAPLKDIFDYAWPWAQSNPGLVLLLLKGARADDELAAAQAFYEFSCERFQSAVHDSGCVLRVTDLKKRIA